MVSRKFQCSRAVLFAVVLLKCFITTETIPNDLFGQLAKTFREINEHFDLSNVRTESAEETRELNSTSMNRWTKPQDTENIPIQQRSVASTQLHCSSLVNWKDLGNMHYPRFIKEVLCTGDSCMHGFYNCRPQYYQVRVLATREGQDEDDQNDHGMSLPISLRQSWQFMDVQISVACMCGL